jgi:hypothetical protein
MQRRTVLRVGGWSFVAVAAALGLGAFYPGGLPNLAGDLCDYNRHQAELVEEQRTAKEIDSALASQNERYELLVQLRSGLATGRVRLPIAADEYLTAVSANPDLLVQYRYNVPGRSDQERMAVVLLRDLFTNSSLPSDEQARILHQFHTTYSVSYPLPLPATVGRNTRELSSQP